MACLIYSLGGGWGHLTRAIAFARREGGPHRILTNSPYAAQVQAAAPDVTIMTTDAAETIRSHEGALVVDTFPRGLVGELAEILPVFRGRKTLLHRDLNPKYIEAYGLRRFVAANYDEVLVPGPYEENAFDGTRIPPLLIHTPDPHPHSGVLVTAAGFPAELAWYGEVMRQLATAGIPATCIAPDCPPGCPPGRWRRHWPAIDLISRAELIVGGGGYHTVYESLACDVPLIARPWPRKYDRQRRRAELAAATIVDTPEQAVSDVCRRRANSIPPKDDRSPR